MRSKLKLRWTNVDRQTAYQPYGSYRLELRSNRDYGSGIQIRYHIAKLWFDQFMDDSQQKDS
jgi:hypothetical protein